MRNLSFLIIVFFIGFSSCNKIKNKTKEAIHKSGEILGSSVTEFTKGVSYGIDKTLACKIILSDSLKAEGVSIGDFSIKDASNGGSDNLFSIYLIFNKDFNKFVSASSFNSKGIENGRAKLKITKTKGSASYFNFKFDKETVVQGKSTIVIE